MAPPDQVIACLAALILAVASVPPALRWIRIGLAASGLFVLIFAVWSDSWVLAGALVLLIGVNVWHLVAIRHDCLLGDCGRGVVGLGGSCSGG